MWYGYRKEIWRALKQRCDEVKDFMMIWFVKISTTFYDMR